MTEKLGKLRHRHVFLAYLPRHFRGRVSVHLLLLECFLGQQLSLARQVAEFFGGTSLGQYFLRVVLVKSLSAREKESVFGGSLAGQSQQFVLVRGFA